MKKSTKVALIGLGVVAGIAASQVGFASAATSETTNLPRGMQTIIEKFNLNQDEVVKVLEENRVAHQTEMKVKFEENLAKLVTEGKLTREQKNAIVAKHNEMQAKMTEDREVNRTLHQEFRTWLESQGIDSTIIRPEAAGHMGSQGMGHGNGYRLNQ